ncbi:MAG: hypothetical protein Q9216_004510 [Gyalolechia sp. 2 TL-2023]
MKTVQLVAEPFNGEEVRVDLIFVHGLADDWQQTWKKDDSSSWIQDLLPNDIPHARIFAYGLNILDTYHKFPSSSTDGLRDYEKTREDHPKRPVIFLAHSLGGLILQTFLQDCSLSLRAAIKGIVFFGTPHLSRQDDQRTAFAAAMTSLGHTVDLDYLFDLGSISDRFAARVTERKIAGPMIGFYERLPVTNRLIVVGKESQFPPRCDTRGMDANHLDMTWFPSVSNTNYQMVLRCLRSMHCLADERTRELLRHSLRGNPHGRVDSLPVTPDGCEDFIVSTQGSPAIRSNVRLALVVENLGHYKKAEERYKSAIDSLKTQGECSPAVKSLGKLAVALADHGFNHDTEEKFRRAAESLSTLNSPGRDDPAFWFCLNKWASLLQRRGQYKHAELYSRCCLEARIRFSGKGAVPTQLTVANLSMSFVLQERYQEANNILRDALENQDLATSNPVSEVAMLDAYAKFALASGSSQLAELVSCDVLRKSFKLHGNGHPFTLNCMSGLAAILARRGYLPCAEALSRHALDGLEHALGNDHPDCVRTACGLADYVCLQRRCDDAFIRHKQVLKKQQMRLGSEHPETLFTTMSLGIEYALLGYWKDSKTLLSQALEGLETCLGPKDIHTIWTAEALQRVDKLQNEYFRDEHVQEQLLDLFGSQPSLASPSGSPSYAYTCSSFYASDEGGLLRAVMDGDERALTDYLTRVKFTPQMLGRALREAAASSQESVMKVLLKSNAPVRGQSGFYGDALQAASIAGNEAIVELLLKQGADITHEGGVLGSALRAAVSRGNEAIVSLLLSYPPLESLSPNVLNSSLRLAVHGNNVPLIEALLRAGADVNAPDELFGTPLQQTSFYGEENIMTLLLNRSADVNRRGGILTSPLQAAIETQNKSAVIFLLEAGATKRYSSTYFLPNRQISADEREKLASIFLKRLAGSLPQRSLYVEFGRWDTADTSKAAAVKFHHNSSGPLPTPPHSENISPPKRVSTLQRKIQELRGGGDTEEFNDKGRSIQGSMTKTKRSLQSLRRRLSGLT